MKLDSSDKEVQEVIEVKEGSDNDDDEKVRKRIASEAKASFGQGEIQKDVYAVCRKRGQQSYIGDVIETAYGNLVDRERRLVSFNLPNGVMTDSDIHESAHDRPLEIFLASQKTSQEAKDCSPKSILAELSQAWLDWLQLCNEKHQFMEVDLVEEMSELMNKLEHPKAEDIMSYEFDNVSFPWKSTKQTLNCGVF
uniref:Uncharacterized protein n=1 Tax=Chenopodium quinoa TaxID=63459 RepID=A0A803NEG6_CHEQI